MHFEEVLSEEIEMLKLKEKLAAIEAKAKNNVEDELRGELKKKEESLNDALETMSKMTAAHQAEIKRITAEAEEILTDQMAFVMEPPLKRKQATVTREVEPIASNKHSASIANPTENEPAHKILADPDESESLNGKNG